jgi:hypothetical protein
MTNYLLGKGERLVQDTIGVSGGGEKHAVYTFAEAKARLRPMISEVARTLSVLPAEACPDDQAVAALTINPEYIAKSYFPSDLLKAVGLTTVGSRPKLTTPVKRSRNREPEETLTTQLFVMGRRSAFRQWDASVATWTGEGGVGRGFTTIEEIHAPAPEEKIKGELPVAGEIVFEVVLHTDQLMGEHKTLPLFQEYLRKLGLTAKFERRFYAGGLCFVDLDGPVQLAEKIALFTPVRALRQMPKLRLLRPTFRTGGYATNPVVLPSEGPLDPELRVAIFDGGLPEGHPVTAWATPIDATGGGEIVPGYADHGAAVTSAFLFGHINPAKPLPRPYAAVDHYRVFDGVSAQQDPHELAIVLERIDSVLSHRRYDLVNLSIGPEVPIEDDDVHPWTAVIDDRLARSKTLATIAVGNGGTREFGFDRVQVPSDCVNALAVGSCDSPEQPWERAPYSSVGPGRSPGVIKPDLVEFGGTIQRPFIVLSPSATPELDGTEGTSFSAPSTLRLAAGIRAHFGSNLNMLAIHALIVHTLEETEHSCAEVGRGRIARSLADVVICPDDTVRVVYQGQIAAKQYIRAPIPVPEGIMDGMVTIKATLCFSTEVDSHHPGNYTRAGLEPVFRPHEGKRKKEGQFHPDSKSFFGKAQKGLTEDELRRDNWKWENCLHAANRFQGKTMSNPVFDIHYVPRLEGRDFEPEELLNYALIVTVQTKNISDLYNRVVRKYATQLEPLKPVIEITVTT